MNTFKTLNETGIVNSPEGILEAILQRFRVTDPYQSKIYQVHSLKGILALNSGNDEAIRLATEDSLSKLIGSYFTEGHEVNVSFKTEEDASSTLVIEVDVVTINGSVSLAWAMQVIEDTTGLPRRIERTGTSYEL